MQKLTTNNCLELPFIKDVSNISPEFITVEDLIQVQLHANNMSRLLRIERIDDNTLSQRPAIREELNRVVSWLYKYNINLTNLLTNSRVYQNF